MKKFSCFFILLLVSFIALISCSNSSEKPSNKITESPDWVCGIWIYDHANQGMDEQTAANYLDNNPQGDFIITKDSYGTNGWSIKWGDSKKFYEEDGITLNCTSYPSIVDSSNNSFKWKMYEDMANESDYTLHEKITNENGQYYFTRTIENQPQKHKAFRFDLLY